MNARHLDDYIRDSTEAMRDAPDAPTLARLAHHVRGELQRQLSGFDEVHDPAALAERVVRLMVLVALRAPRS